MHCPLLQLLATSAAVGLMVGAGLTRAGRHASSLAGYFYFDATSAAPATLQPAASVPTSPSSPAPPAPPLPSAYTGLDGSTFRIIEDLGNASRHSSVVFGQCASPQLNSLDTEGMVDGLSEPSEQRPIRGCAVGGLEGTVVVLTPMRNRAHESKAEHSGQSELAIERYFRLLQSLSYPRSLITVAILCGDSTDDTYAAATKYMEALQGQGYRRLLLLNKDFGESNTFLSAEERHRVEHQLKRRAHLARVRNWLAVSALRDEEWALWLDADLFSYPQDLIEQLLSARQDFVVPHCVMDKGGGTFDFNSWQETEQSLLLQDSLEGDEVLFEGYEGRPTYRKHMDHLRTDGTPVVPLDGVGGAVILIRSALHREGVLFPSFPFNHAIETEGLAKCALAMGYQPYGMPFVEVVHK